MGLQSLLSSGRKHLRNAVVAGLVSLPIFLGACAPSSNDKNSTSSSSSPSGGSGGTSQTQVHVLSDNELNQVYYASSNQVSFYQPMNLSVGNILASGISSQTPNGLLRKITSVSSDKKTFFTTQSTLEEALISGSFLVDRTVPFAAYPSALSEKNIIQNLAAFNFNIPLSNIILYDADTNLSTPYDQIIANGNISFNSEFIFELKNDGGKISRLMIENITDENSTLEITALGSLNNILANKRITGYNFAPFTIYTPTVPPLPVVIQPQIEIFAGFSGSVSPMKANVSHSISLNSGVLYDNGSWSPMNLLTQNISFSPITSPTVSNFKAFMGPQLNLSFYGVAGPDSSLDVFLNYTSTSSSWNLYGGIEANVGIDMGIFSSYLQDYSAKVTDYTELLASGQIVAPPPTPTNTITIQPGPSEVNDAFVRLVTYPDGTESYSGLDTTYLAVNSDNQAFFESEKALIQFPTSLIPSHANIVSAKLGLYGQGAYLGETATVNVKRIFSPWNESTVKWNTIPLYGSNVSSSVLDDGIKWHEWDVTLFVQSWSDGGANYGMILETNFDRHMGSNEFKSSDSSDSTKRPRLVISYK